MGTKKTHDKSAEDLEWDEYERKHKILAGGSEGNTKRDQQYVEMHDTIFSDLKSEKPKGKRKR